MRHSLRRTLLVSIVAMSGLALLVAAALVWMTTELGRNASELSDAVESVRLTREAELELLVQARATDPYLRAQSESGLRQRLDDARRYVTTTREQTILDAATHDLDAYLAAKPQSKAGGDLLDSAFRALDQLAQVNIDQARDAQQNAARFDFAADVIGVAVGLTVLFSTLFLIFWLRGRAFEPVLHLAKAIERFRAGDRNARAPEVGPVELAESARNFNEMATELGRQHEAQYAFLAGVAHDLRNPIAALKIAVGRMNGEGRPLPPEEKVRQLMGVIDRQLNRMERMVSDVMDASQIESGRLEVKLETRDLRELATAVAALFSETSERHTLRSELGDAPIWVRADPLRMEQVITNLVSNAIKYSPAGGTVVIRAGSGAGHAVLSVSDEGIGITPADQERLFEPFRRVGASKEAIPGVGLGLFVVRRIVETHGGSIAVTSQPLSGSTFTVTLPLAQLSTAEHTAPVH